MTTQPDQAPDNGANALQCPTNGIFITSKPSANHDEPERFAPNRTVPPAIKRTLHLLGLAVVLSCVTVRFALSEPREEQVKAAYLYNFAKFMEWPEESSPPGRFNICFEGNTDQLEAIESLAGKSVNDQVVHVRQTRGPDDLADCQILFLQHGWADPFTPAVTGRTALLTVGDGIEFAEDGGVIGLFTTDRKLRFAINVHAAAAARLKISSKLLNLARILRNR
ncbi:MAG: YfiR family protein [Geminicoccaceae bacterium]|nr:YfiR family protein [Geminicoccaceae bacterium]